MFFFAPAKKNEKSRAETPACRQAGMYNPISALALIKLLCYVVNKSGALIRALSSTS